MTEVFHPALKRNIKIGGCRLPTPAAHAAVPRLDRFVAIPATPPTVDWCTPATIAAIRDPDGNTSYGDCVYAEEAHFLAIVTANANTIYRMTEGQTLAMYAETGFTPSDPNTDNGADPISELQNRVVKGYPDGSKLDGFATVDMTNRALVQFALAELGPIKLWCGLPDNWITPFPTGDGWIWDVGTPDQNNGHCFGGAAYESAKIVGANCHGLQILTWGQVGTLTWAAAAATCVPSVGGGAAIRVTKDWVNKTTGKTPSGLDYAGLIKAFDTYLGGTLPIPAPPPAPAPVPPAPTTAPTLAQAQAALKLGFVASKHGLFTLAQAEAIGAAALVPLWPKS